MTLYKTSGLSRSHGSVIMNNELEVSSASHSACIGRNVSSDRTGRVYGTSVITNYTANNYTTEEVAYVLLLIHSLFIMSK